MQIETIKSGKLFRATEIDALNGDVIEGIYGSIEKEKLQQGCLLEMDLSRAKSVTARGVAGFLRIYKFLESRGASLEIMAIGKNLSSVFRLLRLTRFFDIREKGTGRF